MSGRKQRRRQVDREWMRTGRPLHTSRQVAHGRIALFSCHPSLSRCCGLTGDLLDEFFRAREGGEVERREVQRGAEKVAHRPGQEILGQRGKERGGGDSISEQGQGLSPARIPALSTHRLDVGK